MLHKPVLCSVDAFCVFLSKFRLDTIDISSMLKTLVCISVVVSTLWWSFDSD